MKYKIAICGVDKFNKISRDKKEIKKLINSMPFVNDDVFYKKAEIRWANSNNKEFLENCLKNSSSIKEFAKKVNKKFREIKRYVYAGDNEFEFPYIYEKYNNPISFLKNEYYDYRIISYFSVRIKK